MKNELPNIADGTIIIRRATLNDVAPLMKAGFPFGEGPLRQGIRGGFRQTLGLATKRTGLAAQHLEQKRPVGFISYYEHTPTIYSIKDVFTDPSFRKMGVASGLVNYVLQLAKERGAKKVFINPNSSLPHLKVFYQSLGFNQIVDTSIVWGAGHTAKWQTKKNCASTDTLILHPIDHGKRADLLFKIYKRCMGDSWVNFFETNNENIINGFSQDFRNLFSRTAFVSEQEDLFALFFHRPLQKTGFVELYPFSTESINNGLDALLKILCDGGVKYARLNLFNVKTEECFDLLREREFYPFGALVMGRYL
jgi:GNAT superfamily N-acetyltransferase